MILWYDTDSFTAIVNSYKLAKKIICVCLSNHTSYIINVYWVFHYEEFYMLGPKPSFQVLKVL